MKPRRPARRSGSGRHVCATLLLATAAPWGCRSSAPAPADGSAAAAGAAEDAAASLVNADNGLEVRRWFIDDAMVLPMGQALADQRSGRDEDEGGAPADTPPTLAFDEAFLPEADRERLHANGLRLARLPVDQLDEALAALGGSPVNVNAWHGQVLHWRPLQEARVQPAGQVVIVDGRVRRLGPGALQLLVRSWVAQMEDGPGVHFQWAMHFAPQRTPSYRALLDPPSLDEQTLPPRVLEGLELQLAPEWAYVLTAFVEADAEEAQERAGDAPAAADVEVSPAGRERPTPRLGPPVVVPPTVGEMLFEGGDHRTAPRRLMLVLVPKVDAALYPPPLADRSGDDGGSADGDGAS